MKNEVIPAENEIIFGKNDLIFLKNDLIFSKYELTRAILETKTPLLENTHISPPARAPTHQAHRADIPQPSPQGWGRSGKMEGFSGRPERQR